MLTYDVLVRYASAVRCGQCVTPLTANLPAELTLCLSGMRCHPLLWGCHRASRHTTTAPLFPACDALRKTPCRVMVWCGSGRGGVLGCAYEGPVPPTLSY